MTTLHAFEPGAAANQAEPYRHINNFSGFASTELQKLGLDQRDYTATHLFLLGMSDAEIAKYQEVNLSIVQESINNAAEKAGTNNQLQMAAEFCRLYTAYYLYDTNQISSSLNYDWVPPALHDISPSLNAKVDDFQAETLIDLDLRDYDREMILASGRGAIQQIASGPSTALIRDDQQLEGISETTSTKSPQQLIALSYGIRTPQSTHQLLKAAAFASDATDSGLYASFMNFTRDEFDRLRLYPREMEITTLAIQGLSTPAIGRRLGLKVSEKHSRSATAQTTLERVFKKVNILEGVAKSEALTARLLERHAAALLGRAALGPLSEDNSVVIPSEVRQQIEQKRLNIMADSELNHNHIETIGQIGKGLTNKKIGENLFVSKDSVKARLLRAYALTKARHKIGLLAWSYGIQLNSADVNSER